MLTADLNLAAGSPSSIPFGQDVRVSLNETAPLLGADYSEARIESYSLVGGLLFKLPSNWRMNFDAQYARNITEYRGLAPPDLNNWQRLVDQGLYNPPRDTQAFAPPAAFYDKVLVFYGGKGDYVKFGDYQTLDTAFRVTNQLLTLPTGTAVLNLGADYRIVRLADYDQQLRYADGSLAAIPDRWIGRTLQHYSFFGELQAPVFPRGTPPFLVAFDRRRSRAPLRRRRLHQSESNLAPTLALKAGLPGGFCTSAVASPRSTVFPHTQLSHKDSIGPGTGIVELAQIFDPLRSETYNVPTVAGAGSRPSHGGAAVTQTVGVIFQHGQDRHLRISLDFVDTHKTDELIGLSPQATVNLESVYPLRVKRVRLRCQAIPIAWD